MNRKNYLKSVLAGLLALLLGGCASSGPGYDDTIYNRDLTPKQAAAGADSLMDEPVLWGGMIIHAVNTEQGSQLEILGYPLASDQRPNLNADPVGRFILVSESFLEPLDYSEGREVTVTGSFTDTQSGEVGSTNYLYPVVDAEHIHLWSRSKAYNKPQIHFGFGFVFGS